MQKKVYEYISKQTGDPIVEWKTCKVSGSEFPIYQSDMEFYDKISPTFNGVKYQIPAPTLCPEERQKRRLSFRNERKLYKRTCDATGKQIISIYSPDKPYKVYDQKIWRSDQWDPMEYGQEYDFEKTFFEQFDSLNKIFPNGSMINIHSENSEYCNRIVSCKNSYLLFCSDFSEDCYYSYRLSSCVNVVDCNYTYHSRLSYGCLDCENVDNCINLTKCKDCHDCIQCDNCVWCTFCIWCTNLVNKNYCISNKQFSKEEYEIEKNKFLSQNSIVWYIKNKDNVYPSMDITSSENCIGNEITNGKNLVNCYSITHGENCKNIYSSYEAFDSQDCCYAWGLPQGINRCYELTWWQDYTNCLFSNSWVGLNNVIYSTDCYNSSNLFGCIGLRNKEYCILNKQYTKEQYEAMIWKIIKKMQTNGERGEFFPASISPFGYNETVAQEYFPSTKEDVIGKWYKRSDYEMASPQVDGIVCSKDLPANISQVDDTILTKAIACEVTGKPFRIMKSELEFYRRMNISIPHKHPDQRHTERMAMKPPKELFLRTCDSCWIDVLSVYDVWYDGNVYCQNCYTKEIYN